MKITMKTLSFFKYTLFIAMAVIGLSLSSCDDDDNDDDPDPIDNTDKFNDSYTLSADGNSYTIADAGQGTGSVTWTKDKVWILDGFVFVNEGQSLTIEAGTTIKGKPGQEADASALIVARGGKINAVGTPAEPIIMTAEADDGSMAKNVRGQWGGLIVLGAAGLNSDPGTTQIEGIPTTEPRGSYGGSNDADNSGTLKYISIRHGGTNIGEGNEINGLTLGGVGSGTVIEYIEVVANKDDGVEFFGGTAQLKNILVSYCGDDSYDYDEGFRGKGQFWVAVQDKTTAARCGEHDGGTDPEDGTPYATPIIYNATYIGHSAAIDEDDMIRFRDNAGGNYINSIFAEQAKGISIEILATDAQDSFKQFEDGNLKVENCIFWNIADNTPESALLAKTDKDKATAEEIDAANALIAEYWTTSGNSIADPGVSDSNPVPTGDVSGAVAPVDSWFTNVSYKGAFDPNGENWAKGWTLTFPSK